MKFSSEQFENTAGMFDRLGKVVSSVSDFFKGVAEFLRSREGRETRPAAPEVSDVDTDIE